MAALTFFYGTMNCGKSTLALQHTHTLAQAGKSVLLLTLGDRAESVVSSRIGLSRPAVAVTAADDVVELVRDRLVRGAHVDELVLDEAQFSTPAHVEQLARVVDDLGIDVAAFGLLSDFQTRLFPGSQRLLELADVRRELQVRALCWCGEPATHNARTVDGRIVRGGAQVLVGDLGAGGVAYEVLCRRHHRDGVTRRVADDRPGELLLDL